MTLSRRRVSNEEATPQEKENMRASPENGLSCNQQDDKCMAQDTTSDSDCFTDAVNVNKLRILTDKKYDPENVLAKLLNPGFGFVERMKRGSYTTELTELLIKVIAIACKSTESDLLTTFLNHINESEFFGHDVVLYVNKCLSGQESINIEVFNIVIEILRCLVTVFPSRALNIVTQLSAPISYLQKSTYTEISFDELKKELQWAAKHRLLGVPTRDTEEEEFIPVNASNYKCMSVTPTCEDIKGRGDPYLRKNKVFSRYTDVDDYLDVQFRLLREDLVRPLRDGLADLLESRKEENRNKRRRGVMKVYQKVQIVSGRCSPGGIVYKLQFDTSRLKRVRWGAGKRLIFGSLVCLSADQFQTMLVGTIAERNVSDLYNGIVFVNFENDNTQSNSVEFNCYYEMIESPAFYEPYKNVLGVLQHMDEKALPFQRYLLNHGYDQVPPPKYLASKSFMYNFSSAIKRVDKESMEKQDGKRFGGKLALILDASTWPTADQLDLDDSQYDALKAALTKEFAVIQGPPGTGKTFIGVLIVQLLLANKYNPWALFRDQSPSVRQSREPLWDGPILIVCYTNHALDQFLEEIISRHPDKVCEGKIVRLGSRCSSENESLKQCQLFEIMRQSSCRREIGCTKSRLCKIEEHLTRLAAFVELTREELLHEDDLHAIVEDFKFRDQFEMLTLNRGGESSVLLHWLYDRRGNAWQSYMLRKEARDTYIQDDVDYCEGQWDAHILWQCDVGNAKPKTDFQECKEKLRKHAFLNVPRDNLNFQPWKSVRKIHQTFQEEMPFSETNVWNLSLDNRWRLYNYWVSLSRKRKMTEWQNLRQEYLEEKQKLDTILHIEHCHILAKADIVAMTTSAAAKNSKLLKAVMPKIVIVEEAAEVLEAHLVASLSEGCEHLILIGDHKQLRPKPADDRLAKHYWLHVSLFERMVLNRMKCECLAIQHRMRPEISKLLVPHIYRSLTDHGNVKEYEDIAGVMGNLFFLNHSFEENCVDDIQSHSNEHEAAFLAAFCKYLLNVGHSPAKITVLTLYTGQLFLLRKYFPKEDFEGVRITPVDNFQGEENDIILLSLVRSNKKNNIGFLSIPNRVCVALSRARKGLYVIGNGDLLRDTSPLWRDILDTLKHDGRLVEKMTLGCRKHPDAVSYVSCAADFDEVPRDGCKQPCEVRLECGHVCERNCHVLDPGHKKSKCMKPCQRKPKRCRSDHSCLKQCHEECGNCPIPVQRTLDRCQHTVTMQCHKDERYFKCKEPCKRLCPAGHKCGNPCYEEFCVCTEPVKRTLIKCQHEVSIPCNENERLIARAEQTSKSSDISDEESRMRAEAFYYCHEPCKKQCDSGHACKKQCYEACSSALCTVRTEKVLPNCQHKAVMPCNLSVDYYDCLSRCEKMCEAGDHQCTRLCSEACGKCEEVVVKTLPLCSHEASIPCYLDPLFHKCRKACEEVCLAAGHPCVKECGKWCGGCTVQVDKTLPECQHTVQIECHVDLECVVCQMPCEKFLSCGHQCQDICGAAICSQFCAIPVDRTLSCKHVVPLPCSEDATNHLCCEQVEVKTCEDGHTKMVDCYKRHEEPAKCTAPIKLSCSTKLHDYTVPCHTLKNSSAPSVGCPNTCNVELDCGHRCQNKCEDCVCTGKHSVCRAACDKQFSLCLHKCTGKCGSPCEPCLGLAKSRCPHIRFDAITLCVEVSKSCYEQCKWSCPHHSCRKACWEPCERPPCNRACGKLLRCTHYCAGLCGEPCSSKCRQCDRAEFAEIENQLGIRFTLKSRFVELQPCSHLVETNYMDNWVKRFQKNPPCYVDSSLILKCPICKDKVVYCPRYNKVIKGAEWLLSEAKRGIGESKTMKKKITVSAERWLRTNEYSQSIGEDLRGNGNGARLRLGSICILYEIQCQLKNFAGSITAKYGPTVDKIGEQVVNGEPTYCKSLISGDIITLFRIYMEIRILRLEKLIRGPKLEVVLRCRGHMKSLPPIEAPATDFLTIWRTIEKVNKSLSMELKEHEGTDDIDDYLLYLNKFYDVELNASYMSQWICCSKGHVYPNEGTLDKDRIDSYICPLCHPVHEYLLKNIRSPSADKKDIARSKQEKTTPAKDRTTRVIVIKDNNADQKKIQPLMEQGTDTPIPTITGIKRKNSLRTSSQNDEQMEKMKRGERLGSGSSTVPKLEKLVPEASCQLVNEKVVPLLSSDDVRKCRGDKETERRHTAESSSRKPTRGCHDIGDQVSHETNAALEKARIDKRNEKRSQSKDQRRNERDKSHLKNYTSRTSATKSSHRHNLSSEPDSGRSPDRKRRRRDDPAVNDQSQFQAEMGDRMKYGHSRHSRDSRENHERRYHRRIDYDAEHRDRRTSPVQSRVRHSQHRQWSHGDSDTSSYGYEYTRDEDYHGYDDLYQREESVVYEHSQFEAEVADWEEPCHSRDLQYSSGTYYEGTRPEWGEFSGRDADDGYGLQRTPPMSSRERYSESSRRRHRGNTATSRYDGASYQPVEPYETNSGEEMSWRSHGIECAMNRHHDRRSQNDEEQTGRDRQTWNRGVTGTDTDTDRPPNQRNKPPDLRDLIISSRVRLNHLSNEPISTLNERFPDFDRSSLTPSSSQAYDRPIVSYDDACFGPLLGD